jgi:hypothetical protein
MFGGWVLITASNKCDGRPGRVSHKVLHHLFAGVPDQARAWMRTPNSRFDQAQPLNLMLVSLDGLKIVRSYLEGEVDALFEQPSAANLPPDRGCAGRLGS